MEYKNWHRESNFYVCKRLRMLEHLKKNGYLPIRSEPDINNPKYTVWIFKNSEGLADTIEEYLIEQEKIKK